MPFNPSKEIIDYCKHICHNHMQVLRLNNRYKTWFWDYPAMACICHNAACTQKRASYSHHPQLDEWHPVLSAEMQKIAPIGKQSKGAERRYIIGQCAEQHAANIYMKQLNENNLNNLFFSPAMRPRTKQVFQYCNNCSEIFPII